MRVGQKLKLPQRQQDFVARRLKEMEGHRFLSMDEQGNFQVVGEPLDEWTPEELQAVMPEVRELAADPARGDKISKGGLEEAAVALSAENLEVFEDLTRESTGSAEFEDENGVEWDVKSPLSPPPGQNWEFSPHHQLEKVRHDFAQGDKVLFNLTRLDDEDRGETIELFRRELRADERDDLLFFTDFQEVPTTPQQPLVANF